MPFETLDLPPLSGPQPIDIELACQWAISRSGRLPWLRTNPRELEMNQGLTMRPRKRPLTSWAMAEACAGLTLRGRAMPAMKTPGADASLIINAIMELKDTAAAATVIACARGKIRPDWMPGVVPRVVMRPSYGRKKNKKRRGRPIMIPHWTPCTPGELKAAREIYSAWHSALLQLVERLQAGDLQEWIITGLAAPATPWESGSSN